MEVAMLRMMPMTETTPRLTSASLEEKVSRSYVDSFIATLDPF